MLSRFLIRCGIPFQIVTDNHKSYVGKDSDFYKTCRNKDIQQLAIEPYSHWQNLAEAAIRELKRLFNKVQKPTSMPSSLILATWKGGSVTTRGQFMILSDIKFLESPFSIHQG